MADMFLARLRFSGMAIGYNIMLALFGGATPLAATWLITITGRLTAPAWYLVVIAAVTFIFTLTVEPHPENRLASGKIASSGSAPRELSLETEQLNRSLGSNLDFRASARDGSYCIDMADLGLGGLPCPRRLELFERASLIAEQFERLDEGLVSRDRRATCEKIETEPKIRKWFQDLTRLST